MWRYCEKNSDVMWYCESQCERNSSHIVTHIVRRLWENCEWRWIPYCVSIAILYCFTHRKTTNPILFCLTSVSWICYKYLALFTKNINLRHFDTQWWYLWWIKRFYVLFHKCNTFVLQTHYRGMSNIGFLKILVYLMETNFGLFHWYFQEKQRKLYSNFKSALYNWKLIRCDKQVAFSYYND